MSTKTVLRAIHRGHLRASRLGEQGAYRIREADAESWIDACVLEAAALPRVAVPPAPRGGEPPLNGRLVLTRDMGRS